MFAQVHCPEKLEPKELDDYLSRGWFRMGQTIFTTNFLNFKNQFYSAIWLRVELEKFKEEKQQKKLFKQNASFRTEIKLADISQQKERLYSAYKSAVSFEASPSLNQLLYGKALHNIYTTYEVNMYDGAKLIATGFFDTGKESAMGITSFYDPEYKKYSLGKHLIYLKMFYCQNSGLRYFYPGYFAPGYPFFDYKLSMGKPALQFLKLSSAQWLPIDGFTPDDIVVQVMQERLHILKKLLDQTGIENHLVKYEFFYANQLPDLMGTELFDFPFFIYCFIKAEEGINPIIVFDVRDSQYHLLKCTSIWEPPTPTKVEGFYSSHLLKIGQDIFSTNTAEEMVELFRP